MNSQINSGSSAVLYLTLGGLTFAAITFLVLFITSPRAKTSSIQLKNLRIPPMSSPPRPTIPPLKGQATLITVSPQLPETSPPSATQSAETEELTPSPQSTTSSDILTTSPSPL